MKRLTPILLFLALGRPAAAERQAIDLAGDFQLHLQSTGEILIPEGETVADPASLEFSDRMELPGTTDLAGKGPQATDDAPFEYHLTRESQHLGPAYYRRTFTVTPDWADRKTELFLERVMWQSRVWIDGREAGPPRDSLNTPHRHALGALAPGEHELVIRIDNRMIHPIGDKGHAYGAQTQSTWNGVVGRIELRPVGGIDRVRTFPELDGRVRVEVTGALTGRLTATVLDDDSPVAEQSVTLDGADTANLTLKVPAPRLWSEFSPTTYGLELELTDGSGEPPRDTCTTRFGFRTASHEGNQLLINGRPAFMRGNLECAVFPKTGHPPVTVEAWKAIWQVYRDHHLNHARFHSWCPPEAAFTAADEMGIYLQVEAPIWIDHWMTKPNPRTEMDTAGHPQGLGKNDRSIDAFARAEIRRTLDTYGNHPSFVFFCIGNELGTSNFEETGRWIRDAKAHDPRHLYAASTARTITPDDDFNATHNIPRVGWVRQHVEFGTDWDYESKYSRAGVPIIAHEIGQWPVYVDWENELAKYTGPLKPYRLEDMAADARKNGLHDRANDLRRASGATNRLLYRYEIESFLRTPSCRGFQLLGMQDFSGQGEALVGWLDAFYDSKGTTDPAEFRRYCAPTVPLLKLPAFVFRNSDSPGIEALVRHHGPDDLKQVAPRWSMATAGGETLQSGTLETRDIPRGRLTSLGRFTPEFSALETAGRVTLTLTVGEFTNAYDLWIYPDAIDIAQADGVVFTSDWQGTARPALEAGKRVVLDAHMLGGKQAAKQAAWFPLYWSVPFFPGQNRETIGLFVDADHPALSRFPTPGHGDWNWHRLGKRAHGFDLTDITPASHRPMAEPVSDFHLNRRLGSIFEARVGEGRLLVCGYRLDDATVGQLPEAAQLRHSLLDYAAGPGFEPSTPLDAAALDRLFDNPELKLQELPERFTGADLYINAAGKLPVAGQSVEWAKGHDQILRQSQGVDYAVEADGLWRDDQGSAWHGRDITLTLQPRSGVPGTLYVRFDDWNRNGRTGTVSFEGKPTELAAHPGGTWLEFPVIREDTNDAELLLVARAATGPNLMITDVAFVPGE